MTASLLALLLPLALAGEPEVAATAAAGPSAPAGEPTVAATAAAGPPAPASEPTVVATAAAESASLSRKDVRKLFTGRKRSFANGVAVRLLLPPPGSAEMDWLTGSVLGLPPDVYRRYLAEQAYRRGDPLPPTVEDASDAISAAEAQVSGTSVLTVVARPANAPLTPVVIAP